jgi:glycosyltransferase involved in cell wall biosynthesis
MRIGVDLQAIQAPSCQNRGIGRYAKALLRALLVEAPSWELVFYVRADLGLNWDHDLDHLVNEWVTIEPDTEGAPDGTLQRIVQRNPDGLDWLLVANPLVERDGLAIPEPVPGGPRLAAVVHDLIPLLFPRHYLADAGVARAYDRDLRRLAAYDRLLANSEATRHDAHRLLGVPERRIVSIGAAADDGIFSPAGGEDEEAAFDERTLLDRGVTKPFFYYLGNVDWRKNVIGLVDVFSRLPEEIREGYQLVLTFQENAWFLDRLRTRLQDRALREGEQVILTGPASDEAVRAFYRRAELFLSPSHYEGFGLPILEAMQCGAVVVAADNSSQPEVVGGAGVLARTDDVADWAGQITSLVSDPDRREALGRAAIEQARTFSWAASARRLRDALDRAPRSPARRRDDRTALIPVPARGDLGFDPEVAAFFEQLCLAIDPLVFCDNDRIATLPPRPLHARWHDRRLIERIGQVAGVRSALYLIDTLDDPDALAGRLRDYPGAVIFGNRAIAAWTDLVGDPAGGPIEGRPAAENGIEESMSRLIRHATSLACRSPWLQQELLLLAERDGRKPVRYIDGPGTNVGRMLLQAS